MLFSMIKNFLLKAHTTIKNNQSALSIILGTLIISPSYASQLTDYSAEYDVMRKGERYGTAVRTLEHRADGHYEIKYSSDISWMVFSDKRTESSVFSYIDNKITPISYRMLREGTGRDHDYQLYFDRDAKKVISNQEKFPLKLEWDDTWQDGISYQEQMRLDLLAGQEVFDYQMVDKKGSVRHYTFKLVGKETITLPFGNVEAVKIERVYDNDKRQAIAWLAPEMDYLLVRMWKGEKNVEQFDVQLKSVTSTVKN